jgi:hypothetical protein
VALIAQEPDLHRSTVHRSSRISAIRKLELEVLIWPVHPPHLLTVRTRSRQTGYTAALRLLSYLVRGRVWERPAAAHAIAFHAGDRYHDAA